MHIKCLPDTTSNSKCAKDVLKYGVVYDDVTCRVVFIDLNDGEIISKLTEVDSTRPLWGMFGVYNTVNSVSMKLVVGADIDMTETKKSLILEALS